MIGPPPVTDDIKVLRRWCEDLYQWIIFPDKLEVNFIELQEQGTDIDAPGANRARIYCKDSGGGKTLLVSRFNSGAVQTVATEP